MMRFSRLILIILIAIFPFSACQALPFDPPTATPALLPTTTHTLTPSPIPPTPTLSPTPIPLVPDFTHIIIIIFENKEFGTVIGNPKMPYFNILANTYTLLTEYYATTHPSLPNYISMIGGDTFGITDNCTDCFIDEPSLPDFIEESGRTWKTYQDDMPDPCFVGDTHRYVQKHNPFIYFDPIRLNDVRCKQSVVPLTQMDEDILSGSLPSFIFITPDICYSAHDCDLDLADSFLKEIMNKLVPPLDLSGEPYLIILTWDEGQGTHSCCGLPESAGGRIATVLVSPQVKSGFQDNTPYSHYSLLKTIAEAWGLPDIGHAADAATNLMTAPWK